MGRKRVLASFYSQNREWWNYYIPKECLCTFPKLDPNGFPSVLTMTGLSKEIVDFTNQINEVQKWHRHGPCKYVWIWFFIIPVIFNTTFYIGILASNYYWRVEGYWIKAFFLIWGFCGGHILVTYLYFWIKNIQIIRDRKPIWDEFQSRCKFDIFINSEISAEIRVSNLFLPKLKWKSVSAEIIWIFALLFCHCWAMTEQHLEKLRSCKLFLEPNQLPRFVKMAQNSWKIDCKIFSKAMRNISLKVNCAAKRS